MRWYFRGWLLVRFVPIVSAFSFMPWAVHNSVDIFCSSMPMDSRDPLRQLCGRLKYCMSLLLVSALPWQHDDKACQIQEGGLIPSAISRFPIMWVSSSTSLLPFCCWPWALIFFLQLTKCSFCAAITRRGFSSRQWTVIFLRKHSRFGGLHVGSLIWYLSIW